MKKVRSPGAAVLAALLLTGFVGCGGGKKPPKVEMPEVDLSGKRVLMVIASARFQGKEYVEPRRALEAAKARVSVAASTRNECVGMLGKEKVTPDVLLSEVAEALGD